MVWAAAYHITIHPVGFSHCLLVWVDKSEGLGAEDCNGGAIEVERSLYFLVGALRRIALRYTQQI